MEQEKMESLFKESKVLFEEEKKKSDDLNMLSECLETLAGESLQNTIKMLIDNILDAKNQEKDAENKIYFELGYKAGIRDAKNEQ